MSKMLKPWEAWELWEDGAKIQYRRALVDEQWHEAHDRSPFWGMGLEYRIKPTPRYRVKDGVNCRDIINAGYIVTTVDSTESGDGIRACVSLYLLDIDDSLIFLALRCKREGKTIEDFQKALDQIEEVPAEGDG